MYRETTWTQVKLIWPPKSPTNIANIIHLDYLFYVSHPEIHSKGFQQRHPAKGKLPHFTLHLFFFLSTFPLASFFPFA